MLSIFQTHSSKSYFSIKEAAADFVTNNYSATRYVRHEFGAVIYSKTTGGTTTYHCSPTIAGGAHSINYGPYLNLPTAVATVHTHPSGIEFSADDTRNAKARGMQSFMMGQDIKLQEYLSTPNYAREVPGTNINPIPLTAEQKINLVNQFKVSWDNHLRNDNDDCKGLNWPNE